MPKLTDQDIITAIDALLEFIADKSGPVHNNPYNTDLTALKRVVDNLTENLTEPNLTETEPKTTGYNPINRSGNL
jgi:hypothetical protein